VERAFFQWRLIRLLAASLALIAGIERSKRDRRAIVAAMAGHLHALRRLRTREREPKHLPRGRVLE